MTRIVVIDTETDRLDGEEGEARVIELAAVDVRYDDGDEWLVSAPLRSWLFSPGGAGVTPRASAIHHLTDASLASRSPFGDGAWVEATAGADLVAAHNVAFDRTVVERSLSESMRTNGPRWLCTLKLSRVAWPEAPAHGNQVLRYWLNLDPYLPVHLHPHRAGYDATVTAGILIRLLERFNGNLDEMARISAEPSLLPRVGFGKHRGQRWAELPKDYLRWVLSSDFGEDEKHTARWYLR